MSFFLLLNTKYFEQWQQPLTSIVFSFHTMEVNGYSILQNIFFCVQRQKESHTMSYIHTHTYIYIYIYIYTHIKDALKLIKSDSKDCYNITKDFWCNADENYSKQVTASPAKKAAQLFSTLIMMMMTIIIMIHSFTFSSVHCDAPSPVDESLGWSSSKVLKRASDVAVINSSSALGCML